MKRQLILICAVLSITAMAQSKPAAPTHCKADERVVFSCPFKHGKTVSLCASADLTKTTGTLQYRYGVVGRKPELVFPQLGEHENPIYDHPSWNFDWSSYHRSRLGEHLGPIKHGNTRWSTANVPVGESVAIHVVFTPIGEHPEINFVIDAQAGPESRYQGVMLTISESVGKGRTIAEHRCIRNKTTDDLFSLKDIIQK